MNRITLKNLDKIDQSMVIDPNFFRKVEDFIYDIEASGEPGKAKQALVELAKLLDKTSKEESLVRKYLPMMCVLRLISLSLVSDIEKQKFLSENILILITQPYADLQHWLKLLMANYVFDLEICESLRKVFVQGLESSLNLVGTENIIVNGNPVKPFFKNWVIDFNSQPSMKVGRGALEETTYINQSANPRKLSASDREILRKFLHLYDWIRFVELKNLGSEDFQSFKKQVSTWEESSMPKKNVIPVPRPVAPPILPRPIPPPAPKPVMPKVVPVVPRGQDLDVLRRQMEQSKVNFIPPAKPVVLPRPEKNPVFDEIKREVSEKELPPYQTEPQPVSSSPAPVIKNSLKSLNDIQTIDDLKKIDLSIFRQAPLLNQIQLIKEKIIYLSRVNNVIPYYAVNAFEQSPLFQVYLKVGSNAIQDPGTDRDMALANSVSKSGTDITIHEFERIADLREDIEQL